MTSLGNDGDDKNTTDRSQPMEMAVSTRRKLAAATTTTTTSSPTLPFELITEILYKLPVKFLMTLKCVCKNWNSLISDRKFGKKHIIMSSSITKPNLILNFIDPLTEFSHIVYPLRSFLTDLTTKGTRINYPLNMENSYITMIGSCDGMLCLIQSTSSYDGGHRDNFINAVIWNPSIRKYKILPSPYHPRQEVEVDETVYEYYMRVYGFGYDNLTGDYKVVVVLRYKLRNSNVYKNQVKVHTLGTNSWRLIEDFPSPNSHYFYIEWGTFVSGTINWFIDCGDISYLQPIVSLDLGTESYQEILQPDYGEGVVMVTCTLTVLKDCLSILCRRLNTFSVDIWLMKEHGNRESWTKLFNVSYMDYSIYITYIKNVLYISEDDQVLLSFFKFFEVDLVVYDSVNGTLKNTDVDKFNGLRHPKVYIESLISPCS